MSIIQNENPGGQSNTAWLVGRYASSLEQLRGHYESLLRPSHAWRSWAADRITGLRGISVLAPNGVNEGNFGMAGILPPIIYRWMSAAHPYVGSPFSWPRLPLLWYSPLWRLWLNVPPVMEAEPGEEAGPGYFAAADEQIHETFPLAELAIEDGLPSGMLRRNALFQPTRETLVGPRTSHFSLAALPSRLSPARMLTSHGIVFAPAPFSPELAFHPSSLLYPETELVYHSISTLLRMAAHTKLPFSDEQGISPYTYWEPTPALTQNVPLLHHLMPLLTAPITSGPLAQHRLPILSAVAPAIFAGSESLRSRDDVGMRRFNPPLLNMASFPLTTGVHLEPREASWPSLSMPLVSSIHSGLIQAHGFDLENLTSSDAVVNEEQGETGEVPSAVSWATLREIAPSSQKVSSPFVQASSDRMALSRNLPYVPKPEMVLGTFAASLLRELVSRREGMLVSAKKEHFDEEGAQSLATIYPSVTRPLAVFKPDEPYLTTETSELLPTMAVHRGDDALTSAIAQAKSTAFAVSQYSGRLPLTHKALYPTPQQMHSLESKDNLYSAFTPIARVARPVGDLEGAQAPYHEETSPSMYSLEQMPFPDGIGVGEPARTVADLESILTRPYDVTGPWPGGPRQGEHGRSSLATPQPQAASPGYDGWSPLAVAGFASPSPSSAPQPTVARASVDRPTNGNQVEEQDQNAPLDEIVEEVYAILKRRLALERERSWGIG